MLKAYLAFIVVAKVFVLSVGYFRFHNVKLHIKISTYVVIMYTKLCLLHHLILKEFCSLSSHGFATPEKDNNYQAESEERDSSYQMRPYIDCLVVAGTYGANKLRVLFESDSIPSLQILVILLPLGLLVIQPIATRLCLD